MDIVNVINSFIGKKGNIGLRTSYVITELNQQKINNFSYSRGVVKKFSSNNINMSFYGHISRILNAYRIYFNMGFNHRKYDIYLFEIFFKQKFKSVKPHRGVAHLWECSPKIINKLKSDGWLVVLDIPIAPTETAIQLVDKYRDIIKLHPHQHISSLELKSYQQSDRIIVPSVFVKDEIVKLGIDQKKITIVPFGINLNKSYKRSYKKDYEVEGVDFCFAGTINKRKGLDFLLEAWNDRRFSNDRLHLCGRLFPEVKKLLKNYGFNNVILPGFVDTEVYFKKCDVYVFPSILEGSSKSIYEAMNMGLPSIVTHNSGSVITDKEDGFIIDIANASAIQEKMLLLKRNTCLIENMGMAAYQNSKKYSWGQYAKNVINIYRDLSN
jgi:glycosyltransferase involved in cell wall biosynthesis